MDRKVVSKINLKILFAQLSAESDQQIIFLFDHKSFRLEFWEARVFYVFVYNLFLVQVFGFGGQGFFCS